MRMQVKDYQKIVGEKVIESIYDASAPLVDKHIVHVNSTYQGGGVAEILNTLAMLMNDLGLKAGWRILHGTPEFFTITKKFHNTLQGDELRLSKKKKNIYEGVNEEFSTYTHLDDHDCVIIHDPQPLPLIKYYDKRQPWIWRLHIDISNLSESGRHLLTYLKSFIVRYDAMIVSLDSYKKRELPVEQSVIPPSIDPLSPKNMDISDAKIARILKKYGIDDDKPLITQVSRFDKFKDPEGVIAAYKKVREKEDCRLVLVGSMASDDPEGESIYRRILDENCEACENNDIVILTALDNLLVNALQRASAVVVQKSTKEGFGLTVSEALWKKTPVVAGNVGGIPQQIEDGKTGYLVDPKDYDMCAKRILSLLRDPALAQKMGEKGREHVREHYLITRHLKDYLHLCDNTINGKNQK